MKKKLLIGGGAFLVLIITWLAVTGSRKDDSRDVMTVVKRGTFKVEIETTGELEAKNSVKILGPTQLRNFDIWRIGIQSIIDEGTIVKKGDWVATLDRSEFQTKYNQKQIELEKANSKYIQTQLDTTLQMRQSRDDLINLKYAWQEKQIILDQSKFEPPATIKQNEINLEKAQRAYEQAEENNKIKKRQNIEKMREVAAELRKVQEEFDGMTKILEAFNVLAPEDGMVIYQKDWDGKPIKAGSQIGMWNPTVATLPDLTTMMSKTYVNEVDVRKIKTGQTVEIGLDSDPDKKLAGSVIRIANVGEQRPNSDAKVFEVAVEIKGTDLSLRPSMTTGNRIIINTVDSALYVPLECLHSHADSITYVFLKNGMNTVKQEVQVGETNVNDAIVLKGLTENDRVFLSIPSGMEDDDIRLMKELNGKRKKETKKEEQPVEKPAEEKVVTTASVSN